MNLIDVQQIRPLGDLVIVRRHKTEETAGGFVLRESLQGLQKGTVVAVGPGELFPTHDLNQFMQQTGWTNPENEVFWWRRAPIVKVGDMVLYLEGVGQPLRFVKDRFVTDASDRQYMIMHDIHISAVLEQDYQRADLLADPMRRVVETNEGI